MSDIYWPPTADPGEEECDEMAPGDIAFFCTVKKDHKGLHAAYGESDYVPAYVWGTPGQYEL